MDCEVEQYCLRWKYHHSNLQFMFAQLLESQSLCDVTLACEGKTLRVHKIMLSACSAYFDSIFSKYEENDPIVILEGVKFEDVNALVEFMYRGEITIEKSKLNDLIETAEELQVKGLAAVSWRESQTGSGWCSVETNALDELDPNNSSNNLNGNKRKFSDHAIDEKVPNSFSLADDVALSSQSFNPMSLLETQTIVPNSPCNLNSSPFMKKRKMSEIPKSKMSNSSTSENDTDSERDMVTKVKIKTEPIPLIPQLYSFPTTSDNMQDDKMVSVPLDPELACVTKMSDHIKQGGWRPHFWELDSTKKVMEAIKLKKIEMKTGAEILGVTYGTLYGRYREVHGYLKQPQREFWHDVRYAEILKRLKTKEISLFKAADLMNITTSALASHLARAERDSEPPDLKEYKDYCKMFVPHIVKEEHKFYMPEPERMEPDFSRLMPKVSINPKPIRLVMPLSNAGHQLVPKVAPVPVSSPVPNACVPLVSMAVPSVVPLSVTSVSSMPAVPSAPPSTPAMVPNPVTSTVAAPTPVIPSPVALSITSTSIAAPSAAAPASKELSESPPVSEPPSTETSNSKEDATHDA